MGVEEWEPLLATCTRPRGVGVVLRLLLLKRVPGPGVLVPAPVPAAPVVEPGLAVDVAKGDEQKLPILGRLPMEGEAGGFGGSDMGALESPSIPFLGHRAYGPMCPSRVSANAFLLRRMHKDNSFRGSSRVAQGSGRNLAFITDFRKKRPSH